MVSDSSYYFVSNPKYSQILCHIMSQRWMGGANLPSVRGASTSRYVALVAVLTALFTAYGYVSSVELRAITHSVDLFFLLPAFFAILISLTGKKGGGPFWLHLLTCSSSAPQMQVPIFPPVLL